MFISGPTSRTGRTSTWLPGKERDGAVEIDGEAALDAAEDHAADAAAVLERLLETRPQFFAPRLVAAEHGFAESILHPLDIDLDFVADLHVQRHAGHGEFLQRHAAFGLQADIDNDEIVFDGDDHAPDDRSFGGRTFDETCFEHRREIVAARGGNAFRFWPCVLL